MIKRYEVIVNETLDYFWSKDREGLEQAYMRAEVLIDEANQTGEYLNLGIQFAVYDWHGKMISCEEVEQWHINDEKNIDESMDGDFDSAMASAGFGTDEDYGRFGEQETYGADF